MNTIPIFYRPEQSVEKADSYSPSAGKPLKVFEHFMAEFGNAMECHTFEPANREQLYTAHAAVYVNDVLDCKTDNGFGNRKPEVAASLPYTTGSMIAAARHVLTTDDMVAFSPTSGFHHAMYNEGGGFCTFNGLIATAQSMHKEGLAKRVLILDFDQHYGNGTEDIIRTLKLDYITHITANKSYYEADECLEASRFLCRHTGEPFDLVLYQAGADIHVADPLGGILTTKDMVERDYNVFRSCKASNTPLVWNLAGGYNVGHDGSLYPVINLHRNTMVACLKTYGVDYE